MQKINKIILIGRPNVSGVPDTIEALYTFLNDRQVKLAVDSETASMLPNNTHPLLINTEILNEYELVIVVGGDGSLLNAAHLALPYNLPVLGVNRGRLGFLTDIHPQDFNKVEEVLNGHYYIEHRFLLNARFFHPNSSTPFGQNIALNDVVLLPGDISHMISFEIYIDQQFVCRQRADGLIIATPTGSTAYALSGGGPILHPHLEAIVLVPMFPHTLSSRPIVISSSSEIELHISPTNAMSPHISCDGQNRIALPPGGKLKVCKKTQQLRLVHPEDYNYFKTLREKLKWENAPHIA